MWWLKVTLVFCVGPPLEFCLWTRNWTKLNKTMSLQIQYNNSPLPCKQNSLKTSTLAVIGPLQTYLCGKIWPLYDQSWTFHQSINYTCLLFSENVYILIQKFIREPGSQVCSFSHDCPFPKSLKFILCAISHIWGLHI